MKRFTCDGCGHTYPSLGPGEGDTEIDGMPEEEVATLCDGCWERFKVLKWPECICDVRPGHCDSDINVYAVCPVHGPPRVWERLEAAAKEVKP